jgi:predicted MFS family arabinose efflux permease
MSSHVAVEPTAPSHSPDPAAHPSHAERGESRRPWTVFALMIAAQFMVILDVSVVNVALPSISRGLRLSASEYQRVVSVYVLMSGGLLLLGGRIADLFDRRRAFLTGASTFTAASLVSGLAQTPLTLIAPRKARALRCSPPLRCRSP